MMDFQIHCKEIQIFRKEIQAGSEGNQRKTGRKSKLIPSISMAESSLFKDLRRPPRHFLTPLPALAADDNVGVARSLQVVIAPFCLRPVPPAV
jgi:hypothetical protein